MMDMGLAYRPLGPRGLVRFLCAAVMKDNYVETFFTLTSLFLLVSPPNVVGDISTAWAVRW